MKKNNIKLLVLPIVLVILAIAILVVGLLQISVITKAITISVLAFLAIMLGMYMCVLINKIYTKLLNLIKERKSKASVPTLLDIYAILGIPPQYNSDGSLKSVYQLLGINPQYAEDGSRILTIYELLGINPLFKQDGTEIPTILRVKNRVNSIVKLAESPIPLYFKPRLTATKMEPEPIEGHKLPPEDLSQPNKKLGEQPKAVIKVVKQPGKQPAKASPPKYSSKLPGGGSYNKDSAKIKPYTTNAIKIGTDSSVFKAAGKSASAPSPTPPNKPIENKGNNLAASTSKTPTFAGRGLVSGTGKTRENITISPPMATPAQNPKEEPPKNIERPKPPVRRNEPQKDQRINVMPFQIGKNNEAIDIKEVTKPHEKEKDVITVITTAKTTEKDEQTNTQTSVKIVKVEQFKGNLNRPKGKNSRGNDNSPQPEA